MSELLAAIPSAIYYLATAVGFLYVMNHKLNSVIKQVNGMGAKHNAEREKEIERRIETAIEIAVLKERINNKTQHTKERI